MNKLRCAWKSAVVFCLPPACSNSFFFLLKKAISRFSLLLRLWYIFIGFYYACKFIYPSTISPSQYRRVLNCLSHNRCSRIEYRFKWARQAAWWISICWWPYFTAALVSRVRERKRGRGKQYLPSCLSMKRWSDPSRNMTHIQMRLTKNQMVPSSRSVE